MHATVHVWPMHVHALSAGLKAESFLFSIFIYYILRHQAWYRISYHWLFECRSPLLSLLPEELYVFFCDKPYYALQHSAI